MKVRNDFVTNSSSSSFIISESFCRDRSVEATYQLIRGFYKDMYADADKFIEVIKGDDRVERVKGDAYLFKTKDGCWYDVWKTYGDIIDNYDISRGCWVELGTYKEYEEFWKNNTNKELRAPFTIRDMNSFDFVLLHYGKAELRESEEFNKDIMFWYEIESPEELDVCIESESGFIPEYVVDKLSRICKYHCNHMG